MMRPPAKWRTDDDEEDRKPPASPRSYTRKSKEEIPSAQEFIEGTTGAAAPAVGVRAPARLQHQTDVVEENSKAPSLRSIATEKSSATQVGSPGTPAAKRSLRSTRSWPPTRRSEKGFAGTLGDHVIRHGQFTSDYPAPVPHNEASNRVLLMDRDWDSKVEQKMEAGEAVGGTAKAISPIPPMTSTNQGNHEDLPQPGAQSVPVGGLDLPDSQVVFSEMAIAAEVVPGEQDIEAQVQAQVEARVHQERQEITAQAQRDLLDEAVHAHVVAKSPISRHKKLLLGLVAAGIVAVIVGAVLLVTQRKSSPSSLKCSLCSDGFIPKELDTHKIPLGGESVTCADFMASQNQTDQGTDSCAQGQAVAWRYCGCPNLPPSPENASCLLSLDESLPIVDGERSFENGTCDEWSAFVKHAGSSPFFACDTLADELNHVAKYCAADLEFLEFLTDLLRPVSGDDILEDGTPQNDALYWLAVWNPVNMTLEANSMELLQRYVLAVLYFATGGPSWDNDYGFLSMGNVCSWNDGGDEDGDVNGVICLGNVITEIDLESNSLKGGLPQELSALTGLRKIAMENNRLTGTIPQSFGDLKVLKHFDVDINSMTGTIPPSLFDIPTLEVLWLDQNNITGPLPSTIGNGLKLQSFTCGNCSLTGTIPSSIDALEDLSRLDLDGNDLTGHVPAFGGNTRLDMLWLRDNQLSGPLPSTIGSLSVLFSFDLSYNVLTGTIPTSLQKLGNIDYMDLSMNQLSGSLPAWLANLTTIYALVLENSGVTGTIPTDFGRLTYLTFLDLGLNSLNSTVPPELGNCSELVELHLDRCSLTGLFPSSVANLPNLDVLHINGNNFLNTPDDTFCAGENPIDELQSDCRVETVTCSCCTHCCDDQGLNCTEVAP